MNDKMKSYTHVALVLDASGSMSHLQDGTVATMKEFFESLKSPEDVTKIDLWQFDDRVRHLLSDVDVEKGGTEAIENYTTGGCTALYDAICIGIDELGKKFAAMSEDDRPDAVVFAILTDGFENASQHFNLNDVRQRIEHQTSKYNWAFRFLAANQDAVLTGHEMGLAADSCETLVATGAGIRHSSMKLSSMCCSIVRERARVSRRAKKASKDQ